MEKQENGDFVFAGNLVWKMCIANGEYPKNFIKSSEDLRKFTTLKV